MVFGNSQNAGIRADAVVHTSDETFDEASTTLGESSMLQEISGHRVKSDQSLNLSRQRSPRAAKQRKKPRFSTVETRQWSKDDENKFTDVERNLSPLVEPVHLHDNKDFSYAEDTSESIHDCFPTGADLCRTPESNGRRDSLQSDIAAGGDGSMDTSALGRTSGDGGSELMQPFITPDPQRESGSSMAISMPRTDSMPCSVAGSSPCQDTDDAEVTGDVLNLSRLVNEDEAQAFCKDHDMSGVAGGALLTRSPARSEASVGDWGKDWDLYEKFRRERGEDLSDEDPVPVSPPRQEAEAPRSAQGSPTVDMSHIKERLDTSSRTSRSSHGSELDVPEGRKSFSTYVPICDNGPALNASPRVDGTVLPIQDELSNSFQAPSASPSSRRSSGFDFEAVNQQWDQQRGLAPVSSVPGSHTSAATSSANRNTSSNGLVKSLPGYGLLAGLGAKPQGAPSLFGSSTQRADSPAADKMQVDASSIGNEDSGPLQPLQCESEFRTLSGESEFSHFEVRTRLSWEEFLDGCGISFPNLEPFNPVSHNESMSMASALSFDCSSDQRAHEALQQDRAASLQHFTDKLQEKFEDLRRQYSVSTRMWDQSAHMPQIAIDQLQAKRNFREEEKFKGRMKDFQTQCKDQAWINWYALKQQWLVDDIDVVKRHTSELQAKTQRCKEENRRLLTLKKDIQGTLARLQDREDISDANEAAQCMNRQAMRLTHQDLQQIQQRLPQAQAELESEQRATKELRHRVEALRRQKAEAQEKLKEAEHRALQAKLKKVNMERCRYSHTCIIVEASINGIELELRGGARVHVESAANPGDFVKVSLRPPPPAEKSDPSISLPPYLAFGLLQYEWLRSLRGIQAPSEADALTSSPEATVSGQDLQRLLRRLDVAAVRIFDFIRDLKRLRRPLPEVSKVTGELENAGEAMLSVSFELSVIHSHTLAAGGGITPKDPSKPYDVEASQCIVKIKAPLQTFPHFEWSAPDIKPVIGPLNVEAMQHAMQGSTLQEVLTAAIQVMVRAGQRR
mmetsp:Transcript_141929/g.245479  ORF Transcript_141929/g.245479 Transcript_141929/m.245479 type:complete len:1020 (+) Transcript_141929:90-3149(+)